MIFGRNAVEKILKQFPIIVLLITVWLMLAIGFLSASIGHWLWNIQHPSILCLILALIMAMPVMLSLIGILIKNKTMAIISFSSFMTLLLLLYLAEGIYQVTDGHSWAHASPFAILWLPHYMSTELHKQLYALGGLVLLLAFVGLIIFAALTQHKKKGAHFQTWFEAKKNKLINQSGQRFYLGELFSSEVSVADVAMTAIARSRSGKSSAIIIPNVMGDEGSMIINDNRGDLFPQIAEPLKKKGYTVLKWSPYSEATSQGWDPLLYIRWTADDMMDDLSTIVDVLIPKHHESGSESFFRNTSAGIVKALIIYQYAKHGLDAEYLTLEKIIKIATESSLATTLGEMEICVATQPDFIKSGILISIKAINDADDDRTKSNILVSAQQYLTSLYSPKVIRSLSKHDIDLSTIRRKKTAVFIEIPRSNQERMRPFIQLFYTMFLANIMEEGEFIPSKHQWVTCYLDEFGNMAKVAGLAESVTDMGAFGMRFMFILHNQGQVIKTYGEHDAKTILAAGVKLFGATNDIHDQRDFSAGLGEVVKTKKVGKGEHAHTVEERKPLMLPDEIGRLKKNNWIALIAEQHPIKLKKGYWFKNPKLKKLLPKDIKPPI
jgi:type IV secretion system protein VirD4